jgi:hypothetical protein
MTWIVKIIELCQLQAGISHVWAARPDLGHAQLRISVHQVELGRIRPLTGSLTPVPLRSGLTNYYIVESHTHVDRINNSLRHCSQNLGPKRPRKCTRCADGVPVVGPTSVLRI